MIRDLWHFLATDGSENKRIYITGLEDYSVESHGDEDPFSDEEGKKMEERREKM